MIKMILLGCLLLISFNNDAKEVPCPFDAIPSAEELRKVISEAYDLCDCSLD